MGEEQRQSLARLFAGDKAFREAIVGATSADDAARIAGEHGIAASAHDFAVPEAVDVSDAELERAAGATAGALAGALATNFNNSCFVWCGPPAQRGPLQIV